MVTPRLLAIVGPTAAGKSALAIAIASALGGEVVACDSTAVYRGIDIGTDKVSPEDQRGIRHHLIDLVAPDATYSAARYAADAAQVIRAITARGCVPIVVGGTGLYYRALVRGMFPGAARHEPLRAVLERIAEDRGVAHLHRVVSRLDPESALRIQPRDRKRLIRAIEVAYTTGIPLTAHFARTRSPIADYDLLTLALRLPASLTSARVTARVEAQFTRGVVDEVRRLLEAGVPATAHAFSGLVYRQVLELLAGVRDEPATRALIVQENRHYARRQLIWFRKEPNLLWLDGPGESETTFHQAMAVLSARGFTSQTR